MYRAHITWGFFIWVGIVYGGQAFLYTILGHLAITWALMFDYLIFWPIRNAIRDKKYTKKLAEIKLESL